jgi:hypothetical protein
MAYIVPPYTGDQDLPGDDEDDEDDYESVPFDECMGPDNPDEVEFD